MPNRYTELLDAHSDYLQRLKTTLVADHGGTPGASLIPSAIFYRDGEMVAHVLFEGQDLDALNSATAFLTVGLNAEMVITQAESWWTDREYDPITYYDWDDPRATDLDALVHSHEAMAKGWARPGIMTVLAVSGLTMCALAPYYLIPGGIIYSDQRRYYDSSLDEVETFVPRNARMYAPAMSSFKELISRAAGDQAVPSTTDELYELVKMLFPRNARDVRDAMFIKMVTRGFPGLQIALTIDEANHTRNKIFEVMMSEARYSFNHVSPEAMKAATDKLYPESAHAEAKTRGQSN